MNSLEVGARFAHSLARKDWDDLLLLLDPGVTFKGMTPGRFWESGSAHDVIHDVLQRWFDDDDQIEHLEDVHAEQVADRYWLRYRLRVRNGDGAHVVEQQAYYDVGAGERIERMHVMCAGYRPVEALGS